MYVVRDYYLRLDLSRYLTYPKKCSSHPSALLDRSAQKIAPMATSTAVTSGPMLYNLYTHSWFQILLISVICFCCPGVRPHPLCKGPNAN